MVAKHCCLSKRPEAGILSAPSAAMLVALVPGTWIPAFLVGTDELSHTAWVRLEFLPVRRFSLSLCLDHSQSQIYCPAWTWPHSLRLAAEGQLLQPW